MAGEDGGRAKKDDSGLHTERYHLDDPSDNSGGRPFPAFAYSSLSHHCQMLTSAVDDPQDCSARPL